MRPNNGVAPDLRGGLPFSPSSRLASAPQSGELGRWPNMRTPEIPAISHVFLRMILVVLLMTNASREPLQAADDAAYELAVSRQPPQFYRASDFKVFASVKRIGNYGSTILLTMPDHGIRYHLSLNGRDLGISQYGQVLSLAEHDRLTLAEKHSCYIIRPISEPSGLSVISVEHPPGMDEKIKNIIVTLD